MQFTTKPLSSASCKSKLQASCLRHICDWLAGLLANLTCIQAEVYQLERLLSTVRENPLWIVPYSTVAEDYQDLLQAFTAYAQVCLTD